MTHSDDDGLVLPPKLAPIQVVIIPIPKPGPEIDELAEQLMRELKEKGITVQYDRDMKKRPGYKFNEYEMRGVPVRVAIGKRDIENRQVEVARRDTKEKANVPIDGVVAYIADLLPEMQRSIFERARSYRDEHITPADTFEEFKSILDEKGGFVSAHWDGTTETEVKIKELTKATIRCIPLDDPTESGSCILTGQPSARRVLFARAY